MRMVDFLVFSERQEILRRAKEARAQAGEKYSLDDFIVLETEHYILQKAQRRD
ncbi:MAG: hypothetical protein M0R66_01180 [Candidatus Omnitrophica bacterium]|nr:hypothetical protein [Candidatus Omnitrophota bacterium]